MHWALIVCPIGRPWHAPSQVMVDHVCDPLLTPTGLPSLIPNMLLTSTCDPTCPGPRCRCQELRGRSYFTNRTRKSANTSRYTSEHFGGASVEPGVQTRSLGWGASIQLRETGTVPLPITLLLSERRGIGVVLATNHYACPKMRLCSLAWWTGKLAGKAANDSQRRYDELNHQTLTALSAGDTPFEKDKELIAFLSPYRRFPEYC